MDRPAPAISRTLLVQLGFVPLIASILLSIAVLEVPAAPDMEPERLRLRRAWSVAGRVATARRCGRPEQVRLA
jgi:hypothetical protein